MFSRPLVPELHKRNWWNFIDYPACIWDQHLGTVHTDKDLYPTTYSRGDLVRRRTHAALQSSGQSIVQNGKDKFQVKLSVGHFKPDEINVKISDNAIVVHCKHEDRTDEYGSIQREFIRRYMLPERAEVETVKSWVSNDILIIEIAKTAIEARPSSEVVVPVATNVPASSETVSVAKEATKAPQSSETASVAEEATESPPSSEIVSAAEEVTESPPSSETASVAEEATEVTPSSEVVVPDEKPDHGSGDEKK